MIRVVDQAKTHRVAVPIEEKEEEEEEEEEERGHVRVKEDVW